MKRIVRKTLVGTFICATALLGMGSPAMAGEVTGNYSLDENGEVIKGKLWDPKAASECSFSGQNDGFHEETETDRTQTPGGAIRGGMPGRIVGFACNGHLAALK